MKTQEGAFFKQHVTRTSRWKCMLRSVDGMINTHQQNQEVTTIENRTCI